MSGAGRLIAFEGGEGSGKSTQVAYLAEYLRANGVDPVVTREPGGTPGGLALRQLLLTETEADWSPTAETLLMVADRALHVERVIKPALAAGRLVITDRFIGSTLAYQGGGRGVAPDFIRSLHAGACGNLWPDLMLLFDLDPRIGLARSKRRLAASSSNETRFEGLDLAFHERVRHTFLDLAQGPYPSAVIDATQPIDAIQEKIRREIDPWLVSFK